jgi:hypothetical protein
LKIPSITFTGAASVLLDYPSLVMKISTITFTHAARFDITNNCPFTVWAEAIFGRGRQLNQGETWGLDVNAGTTGVAFGLEHGVVSMVPDMVVARPVFAVGFSNAKPIWCTPKHPRRLRT